MSTGIQSVSPQNPTAVHELLRNLIELVKIKDRRAAMFASAALERLARLRAEASIAGYPQWLDLVQKSPLSHPEIAALYKGFMTMLAELVGALRAPRFWSLPPTIQKAAIEVEGAWEALKDSA
jgi:hypothetical protein